MPSETSLTLVNKVLRATGDYPPVATVVGSPANIAETIIDFINITITDLCRAIDFPVLNSSFSGIGDGVTTTFLSTVVTSRAYSAMSVTVGPYVLEEVNRRRLHELRTTGNISGVSQYYSAVSGANNELGVDIFPTPANGALIEVVSQSEPTLLTVADSSVTEIADNDLLVLGALAHMDAKDGMERGYMQLYEASKRRLWVQSYANEGVRTIPESYL